MRVTERDAAVLLGDEGRNVLQLASVNIGDSPFLAVKIEDGDDIGIWVRIPREDGDHLLLVRWEYVLSMDLEAGPAKALGMR
jgi:hypothetical protein